MGLLFSQPGRRTVVGNPVDDPFTTQSYVDKNFFTNDNFDNFYQNDYTAYKTSNNKNYDTLNANYNTLSGDLNNYKTSNNANYNTLNTNYNNLSGDFNNYKELNDDRYITLNDDWARFKATDDNTTLGDLALATNVPTLGQYNALNNDYTTYKTSNDDKYNVLNTNYTTLSGDFDKYKTSNDDRYNTLNTDYRAYKSSSSSDIETLKKSIGLELKNELTKITDSIEQQTGVSVDNYSNAFQRWLDGAYKDFLAEYTKLKTDFNSLDSNYKRIPESTIVELAKENALSKMEDRIVAELEKLRGELDEYKELNDGRYDILSKDWDTFRGTEYNTKLGDLALASNVPTLGQYNALNTSFNTFIDNDTRKLSALASRSDLTDLDTKLINNYSTKAVADGLYAPLGQYNTLNTNFTTFRGNDSRPSSSFITKDVNDLTNYSTKSTADGLYAPLTGYTTLNNNFNTFRDNDTRKLSELASKNDLTNFITKDVSNLTNYVGNRAGADKFAPRDDWSRFIGGVTGAQMTYRIGDYSTKAVADGLYAPLTGYTTLNNNFNTFRDNDLRKLSELASKSALTDLDTKLTNDYYTKTSVNNQIGGVNTAINNLSKSVNDNKTAYDNFLLNDYGAFKRSGNFSNNVNINGWNIDKDGDGKMCFSSLNPVTNTIEKKWCVGQNGEFYTKNMGLEQNKDMYGYIQDQLAGVPVATANTPLSTNVKQYNFGK